MKEYQDEMLDVEKMLILNYKKLGLNDDEVILLLLTYTLYQTGNTFINPSDLALFSNFTVTKIDVLYTNLIAKRWIQTHIDEKGIVQTDLSLMHQKLNELYVNEWQQRQKKEEKKEETEKNVFTLFENFFGRPLSPLEYDIINGWLDKKYTYEEIQLAVNLCAQSANHSIRYIDTILFEEHKKKQLSETEYQNQLQETIELSKIDWLNK